MEKKVYETKEESIAAYTDYINTHIRYVALAFNTIGKDIARYVYKLMKLGNQEGDTDISEYIDFIENELIPKHDQSKFSDEEFNAYRMKFYPCKEDLEISEADRDKAFDAAWEHHKTVNYHHPDKWLIKTKEKDMILPMPFYYLIEMIMDWIAMSMNFKQSTYDWWINSPNGRKEKSQYLSNNRMALVDLTLMEFKDKIDFSN